VAQAEQGQRGGEDGQGVFHGGQVSLRLGALEEALQTNSLRSATSRAQRWKPASRPAVALAR